MYDNFYFLGIGGIGMSALARYFKAKGYRVAGYDRVESRLTDELMAEGVDIHFEDDERNIPQEYRNRERTLVVYTPAVHEDNRELQYFRREGFEVEKRAQVLGQVTRMERALCIAGTHGKTTVSTMTAHLLKQSHVDCNAFLGGVSKNYTSNLLLSERSDLVVIEADEFDRSFHHLSPYMAVITATDADHLDIYGTHEAYIESFEHFTSLVREGGTLIVKKGIALRPRVKESVKVYDYSATEKADFHAENIRIGGGRLLFDFVAPDARVDDVELGVPLPVNVENAVAAMALAHLNGATDEELRAGMASYRGVRRRFDVQYKSERLTMIDDYAHHPAELEASIRSVKSLYEGKKVLGVFQPHLYTRTRDFYRDFAAALSLLDAVDIVEIYPAREMPIEGVTSKLIYDCVTAADKHLTTKAQLIGLLGRQEFDVLLTLGAGDIDMMLPEVVEAMKREGR